MGGTFLETALAAIEFPAALDWVSQYAVTAQGANAVRALRPSTDALHIQIELARVDALRRRLDDGDDVEPIPFGEPETALGRLGLDGAVLEGHELVAVARLLEAARLTGTKLRRAAKVEPVLAPLAPAPLPTEPERELTRALDPDGRLKDEASRDLLRLRRELVGAREELVALLERLLASVDARHRTGDAAVTVRGGRYVIPVRRDARARLGGIVHDESATHATLFVEPGEAIEGNNRLRALEAEEAREVQRILRALTELLRPLGDALEANRAMVIGTDSLHARARVARAHRAAVPEVAAPGVPLALRGATHPLLFAPPTSHDSVPVPFDFVLEADERAVIVSGPNTGGKTVLLKGVGLAVALVQSGVLPPLSAGSVIPVFGALFADIGDRQSIRESLSTFSAHVRALREVLTSAGLGSLVLLDELGTGTDPTEGAALAAATLVALTRRGATTLATTHLGALKELATTTPGVVNASLQFDAATLAPTYRFVKGVPGRSYGLVIAGRLGVDADVLAAAEARVGDDERRLDAMLAAAESRDQELARRDEALRARDVDLDSLAARLDAAARDLAAREDAVRQAGKDLERKKKAAARDVLLEARAEVERAIAMAREGRDKEARRGLEAAIARGAGGEGGERGEGGEGGRLKAAELRLGQRVRIRSLALEGEIDSVQGDDVAVRVRGRRVRVKADDLAAAGAVTPR